MEPRICHLALGSNVGDRTATIEAATDAINTLDGARVIVRSPIIETEAVTLPESEPQRAYHNAAIMIETSLDPRKLLGRLQRIEQDLGRTRTDDQRWEPRTIDIDILLDGDRIIDEPGLTIPHPRMHERRFVLEPLATIAPDAVHPQLMMDISTMLKALEKTKQQGGRVFPRLILAILLITGFAVPPCPAQTEAVPEVPEAAPATPSAIDPDEVFRRITSAYRAAPIAERITLDAVSTFRERSETATVRADAATGAVLLELGLIHAQARPGELRVTHNSRGDRYALFTDEDQETIDLIADSLPSILFPQLSLVFDDPDSPVHLSPFAETLRWTAAMRDAEKPQLVLLGNADGAIVSYIVDTDSWRLKAGVLTVPESALRIEMNFEQIDPGDPADWVIDTRGMIPVLTLSQLQPGGVDIRPGAPAPPMVFFTIDSEPWRLELDQHGPVELLLFRESSPVVLSARDALHEANINHESPLELQPVLVTEHLVGIDLFERIGQTVFAWGGPVLWSASPVATIERFTAGQACIVLISSDHTVRAIVHLGQDEPIETQRQRIDEAVAAFTDGE